MSGALKNLALNLGKKEVLLPVIRRYFNELERKKANREIKPRTLALEEAEMCIESYQEEIKEFNHGEEFEGDLFHPSALGQCLRKLWFQHLKAPTNGEPTSDDALRWYMILETGSKVHVLWQNLCRKAGVLEQGEVSLRDSSLRIIGHADGILNISGDRYVLEIKTINARGFGGLTEAKPEHVLQATAYMKALNVKGTVFVYLDKDRHGVKEYVVPFDEKVWENKVVPRIDKYFKAVKTKVAPEKEGDNPQRFPCSFCEYSKVCYDTFKFSNFLETLKKDTNNEKKNKETSLRKSSRKIKRKVKRK